MFRVGHVHAWDNGLGVSSTEPERTAKYQDLHMPEGLSIRPNKNRVSPLPKGIYPGDYGTPGRQTGGLGCQYTPRKRLVASRSNPMN